MKLGSLPGNARTGPQPVGLSSTEGSLRIDAQSVMWALHILLALSVLGVTAVNAQGGQPAELILINFVGTEMSFTLDGTPYAVPGTDTVTEGGELRLILVPGLYVYSAHIPGSEGTNGEVELVAGQTQLLGARLERSSPVISPTGLVLEGPQDVLVIFKASLTPPVPTTAPVSDPLHSLPVGLGALVFVNYIGEPLTIDIDGTLYTVLANGRLQIDLPPGEVSYSASAGLSGMNGTAQVEVSEYTGLGFTREIAPERIDYKVGKTVPTPAPLKISAVPISLDDELAGGTPSASLLEVPLLPERDTSIPAPAGQGVLTVVNYIGEIVTFTVDSQTYSVAGRGGELTLNLRPGEYTFSASTPQTGTNGSLRVAQGDTTEVSVAFNFESGRMEIYIN